MKRSIQIQHQKELVALSQKKKKWSQQQEELIRQSLETMTKNGRGANIQSGQGQI